jgi:hypothetical protein
VTKSLARQTDYVAAIWKRWLDSVQNIFEVGRMLIEAKLKLDHGAFLEMVNGQLPFGEDAAQRLMAVARNPLLSNADHGRLLPPSWQTLYELSRVPEPTLQRALTDGTVTPAMERAEARALMPDAKREIQRASILCPFCQTDVIFDTARARPNHEALKHITLTALVRSRILECLCGATIETEERVSGLHAPGAGKGYCAEVEGTPPVARVTARK